MKMEQPECSEMSAYKIQTLGNYPEESVQHSEHGESLKSRICDFIMYIYVMLCLCLQSVAWIIGIYLAFLWLCEEVHSYNVAVK
jgi:hypothetical protein